MRRGLLLITVMLVAVFATFSFFIPGNSSALLTYDTQFVITDDMYWVRDLSLFTNKTYDQQLATIDALNISGYTGFHLASTTEVGKLFESDVSTLTSLFPATYTDSYEGGTYMYAWGRTSTPDPDYSGYSPEVRYVANLYWQESGLGSSASLTSYHTVDTVSNSRYSAWVVGSPTPTPIPGALVLFGSGLLGLVGIGRKRFKK